MADDSGKFRKAAMAIDQKAAPRVEIKNQMHWARERLVEPKRTAEPVKIVRMATATNKIVMSCIVLV